VWQAGRYNMSAYTRRRCIDQLLPWERRGRAFSACQERKIFTLGAGQLDPLGRAQKLSKPLFAVAHGDIRNMGHEFHLAADIRVISADVRYRQTENAYGRVPGLVSVRRHREVVWANAMPHLLIGDPWDARTAYRMLVVQEVALNKATAIEVTIDIATRVAAAARLVSRPGCKLRSWRSMTRRMPPLARKSKRQTCPLSTRKI
jgi:enoyl-CoA hydratase/carnithine racemase